MLTVSAQIVFALCAFAVTYIYVGYPVFLWLYTRFFSRKVNRKEILPQVTILITAYNEEKDIRAKLENTLLLDYPRDKFEILVASDGSTDNTDAIVKEFADRGVELFRQEGRVGKTITQNNAVEVASGEVIVFSDATTMYRTDVIKRIVTAFNDESVGCVAGRLIYRDRAESNIGSGAKSYWNYELLVKTMESDACSMIGVSGCLYAVRKKAY